jgi:pimeloyl-ACP methyl ester carboxylesterase
MKQYEIETNGVTLHVLEEGSGPAVVFCHGFPDTSYTWRQQMNAIAAAGYARLRAKLGAGGRKFVYAAAYGR